MVACPSISETILGLTFRDSNRVAHVWRRSWKRTPRPESPARFKSRAKERLRRLDGLIEGGDYALAISDAGIQQRVKQVYDQIGRDYEEAGEEHGPLDL